MDKYTKEMFNVIAGAGHQTSEGGLSMREHLLDEAKKCVCTDRNSQYGSPEDNFSLISKYWNLYLGFEGSSGISAHDVGMMMALLKVARTQTGKVKDDNYIDCIGYLACAGDIALKNDTD